MSELAVAQQREGSLSLSPKEENNGGGDQCKRTFNTVSWPRSLASLCKMLEEPHRKEQVAHGNLRDSTTFALVWAFFVFTLNLKGILAKKESSLTHTKHLLDFPTKPQFKSKEKGMINSTNASWQGGFFILDSLHPRGNTKDPGIVSCSFPKAS